MARGIGAARLMSLALLVACGGGHTAAGDQASAGATGDSADGGAGSSSDRFGTSGAVSGDPSGNCQPNLTGRVRDFRGSDVPGGHPDFEAYKGNGPTTGLVMKELGPDHKPVFASTTGDGKSQQLTSKESFDQWYRDVDGVNLPFDFTPPFVQGANGVATYATDAFFPIDSEGFGNSAKLKDGTWHNYSFTFELHLEFVYRGGESFTFIGDDDLWTFINGHLAIDLGGLHPPATGTVNLDQAAAALGIEKGKSYPLEVFQAERAKFGSTFHIDTTLAFTNCAQIVYPK